MPIKSLKTNSKRKTRASNKKTQKNKVSDDVTESLEYIEEDDEDNEFQNIEKLPTELFSEDGVDGKDICPILKSTYIKKNAMVKAAKTKYSIPQKTNKKCKSVKVCIPKIKEDLKKFDKRKKTDDFNKENEKIRSLLEENNQTRITRSRVKNAIYHLQPDNYFSIQAEKSITSNNTLSKLNKQLDEKKLQELLKKSNHVSKGYKENIEAIYESLQWRYTEWVQIMEEGFNVLLYGLGSKRSLINDFYKIIIADEPTLIINGFFPSLTIKEILDNIATELLGLNAAPNQSECFDIIQKTINSHPGDRIYLLIHNIDGEMLRSLKAQEILSRLANLPNVHILASVDHINAPLIWDNVMRARFNFYWVEASTFLPYQAETSYEGSLLVQKSGTLALLSMKNVFTSLTSNAKKVFIVLVKYQLENGGKNYSGMTFKDLLTKCKEDFTVSSDQALRAQLTDFVDHKLVKIKRNLDGAESLVIPLDNSLLKQFLEQYS